MKIAHLCLSCFYIDGHVYQENELVRQHVADGHDVVVIASTETYGADRALTYLPPGTYMGGEGARVIRLPYSRWLPAPIMRKLRAHPGVYRLLEAERPDLILFHGLCGWELATAARYRRAHPHMRLFADSHEDQHNSARTWVSRNLLHRLFYRSVIHRARAAIEKILCISVETMQFVRSMYGVPDAELEFYPLGGQVFDDAEYALRRARGRASAGVGQTQTMLLQSGKIGREKKLLEAMRAFAATRDETLRFVIAGHLYPEIEAEVHALAAADSRVSILGWRSAEEMRDLLCAADLYVQPGTQSATMQMSLCARCPVILDDVPSHRPFVDGNGWLLGDGTTLATVMEAIDRRPGLLAEMSKRSHEIASRLLDYRKLARRLIPEAA